MSDFATFHLYVCAALLAKFSEDLLREKDFQVHSILTTKPQNLITRFFLKLILSVESTDMISIHHVLKLHTNQASEGC